MLTPITVNYEPVGDDWNISVVGTEKTLTGKAPGLIAARDRADQLVEKLTKDDNTPADRARTVVHLLNGDALAFTDAYLRARLGSPGQHRSDTSTSKPSSPAKQPTTPAGAATSQPASSTGQRSNGAKPSTLRQTTALPTRKHTDIPAPTKAETTQPNASVSNA